MNLIEIHDNVIFERFRKYFTEEALDEDYPVSWDKDEFAKLNSFSARVRYCDAHLEKIKAGSGRVVYKIDDQKVLKLAKNPKGIAQNEVEIEWGNDNYFGGKILADVFDSDDNALWLEMELASKLTASKFKQIVGYDFETFRSMLLGTYYKNNPKHRVSGDSYLSDIPEEVQQAVWDDPEMFFYDVFEFMDASDSPAGDFTRLSSYGIVNRDGHDMVIIVDYGLTNDVYSSEYSR